ncbi:MAG: hypothetical protein JOZ36_07675 [Acidobacteria bacterium]|nr:hypothetical protein [Acidobacteriota bacterium]
MRQWLLISVVIIFASSLANGQESESLNNARAISGMQDMNAPAEMSFIQNLQQHATSGTDAVPNSAAFAMLMTRRREWMFMFHGQAFLSELQQSGRRGDAKLFSTNWFMASAQRKVGGGLLTLRGMLSLEPATITQRRYPELFQQGETEFRRPIIDGQHPHDFLMELAATYDYKIAEKTMLSFYVAPVGDPAMGPPAYPHRASASEDPLAPLGHHLQDSTHIAEDVITVGLTHASLRVEASAFHGREPDEFRWNIDSGKVDSWSSRVTLNVLGNWSTQYSVAQLHSPEALQPKEDVRRMTASVTYDRSIHGGNWASMVLWGRNQNLSDGNVGNAYLVESTLKFFQRNYGWTRIENVDRTNELLLDGSPIPAGFKERYFTRVQAYTAGYDRELGTICHVVIAVGGQFTSYGVPDLLKGIYGRRPVAGVAFIRVRLE